MAKARSAAQKSALKKAQRASARKRKGKKSHLNRSQRVGNGQWTRKASSSQTGLRAAPRSKKKWGKLLTMK